jgi:predicted outer membrane protein
MEVAAGKLAAQHGLDPAVNAFGRKMVTEHSSQRQAQIPGGLQANAIAGLYVAG